MKRLAGERVTVVCSQAPVRCPLGVVSGPSFWGAIEESIRIRRCAPCKRDLAALFIRLVNKSAVSGELCRRYAT